MKWSSTTILADQLISGLVHFSWWLSWHPFVYKVSKCHKGLTTLHKLLKPAHSCFIFASLFATHLHIVPPSPLFLSYFCWYWCPFLFCIQSTYVHRKACRSPSKAITSNINKCRHKWQSSFDYKWSWLNYTNGGGVETNTFRRGGGEGALEDNTESGEIEMQ